jgi:hypothetical protein
LDALTTAINLILVMEFKTNPFDGSETFDLLDIDLHTLSKNKWHEVVKVFKPFLEFF